MKFIMLLCVFVIPTIQGTKTQQTECNTVCSRFHYSLVQQCKALCANYPPRLEVLVSCQGDGVNSFDELVECIAIKNDVVPIPESDSWVSTVDQKIRSAATTVGHYVPLPHVVTDLVAISYDVVESGVSSVVSACQKGLVPDSVGERMELATGRAHGKLCFIVEYPMFLFSIADFSERTFLSRFNPLVQYIEWGKAACSQDKTQIVINGKFLPAMGVGIVPGVQPTCQWPLVSNSIFGTDLGFQLGLMMTKDCLNIGHLVEFAVSPDKLCLLTATHLLIDSYWAEVPGFLRSVNPTSTKLVRSNSINFTSIGDLSYSPSCVSMKTLEAGPGAFLVTYSSGFGLTVTPVELLSQHGRTGLFMVYDGKVIGGTSGSAVVRVEGNQLKQIGIVSAVSLAGTVVLSL